jgi:hypothetical protein
VGYRILDKFYYSSTSELMSPIKQWLHPDAFNKETNYYVKKQWPDLISCLIALLVLNA